MEVELPYGRGSLAVRLPDGLEFRLLLDPTEADALQDHDFDGIRTRDEVRAATDPQLPDAEREATSGVRYSIEDVGESSTPRQCYEFDINGIWSKLGALDAHRTHGQWTDVPKACLSGISFAVEGLALSGDDAGLGILSFENRRTTTSA